MPWYRDTVKGLLAVFPFLPILYSEKVLAGMMCYSVTDAFQLGLLCTSERFILRIPGPNSIKNSQNLSVFKSSQTERCNVALANCATSTHEA